MEQNSKSPSEHTQRLVVTAAGCSGAATAKRREKPFGRTGLCEQGHKHTRPRKVPSVAPERYQCGIWYLGRAGRVCRPQAGSGSGLRQAPAAPGLACGRLRVYRGRRCRGRCCRGRCCRGRCCRAAGCRRAGGCGRQSCGLQACRGAGLPRCRLLRVWPTAGSGCTGGAYPPQSGLASAARR